LADEIAFPIEPIPDADDVFMRAHQMYFISGELQPGVFQNKDGAMSVNWSKYSTAQQTKSQAKKPQQNAVLALLTSGIREIKPLDVIHAPESGNRAHSEVALPDKGAELTEIRVLLLRLAVIVIPLA
jgi:hypothetical protein